MNSQHSGQNTIPVGRADPRLRNTVSASSEPTEVCRNYVWGICNKHGQCKYRHECTREEMTSIINFCHNYQNRNGCSLPNCTYLHTSKEEENLFRTTGQLPRVLMERHAAMNAGAAAAANSSLPIVEGVPPPMFLSQPPPIAPQMTMPAPPLPHPIVIPPPPPPPPPTDTITVTTVSPVVYSAPPPLQSIPGGQMNLLPLPPLFDASRPPPNIINRSLKRRNTDVEAGSSKVRKLEENKLADSMCDKCVQRKLRTDLYGQELEKVLRENESKEILYKSKLEETENMRLIAKLLEPPETHVAIEKYIDGMSNSSMGLSVPMELMMHRILDDRSSSSNMLDSIRLSSMRDLLRNFLLNSGSSPERSLSPDLRSTDILATNITTRTSTSCLQTSNGFGRLLNDRRVEALQSAPPITQSRPVFASSSNRLPRGFPVGPGGAPPTTPHGTLPATPEPGASIAIGPRAAAGPLVTPVFQPSVPPPSVRPYYQPPPSYLAGAANPPPLAGPVYRGTIGKNVRGPPATAVTTPNNQHLPPGFSTPQFYPPYPFQ